MTLSFHKFVVQQLTDQIHVASYMFVPILGSKGSPILKWSGSKFPWATLVIPYSHLANINYMCEGYGGHSVCVCVCVYVC